MQAPLWPAGTVTFLFTDIVGSTRLWETRPDMEDRVAGHLALLRRVVAEHRGIVFSEMGDGIAAAFFSAHDAACAAVTAQSAGADGVLSARMGIHTGDAAPRNGDYFGRPVNRAARVMAVAHGGQIVLTQSSADLLRASSVDGIELMDLGLHRLRDLGEPEHIWQLVHESLATEFPRLRSLDSYAGNLPAQRTTFVGRSELLARLDKFLSSRRLVTLTGVGGAGKTRLALQAAADALPRFPGGAWLVELAPTADPGSVPAVARTALGASALPGVDDIGAVCAHLASTRTLVILDNCEHVLDAASDLATIILDRCPNVAVIATSREGLDLAGEQIVAVRALDDAEDAVELFLDRALSMEPDLHVDESTLEAVRDICARLDGLPLAIELAAARVASTTVSEILSGLDDRFRLLVGGRRRAVERHQTMRATIEWSHQLLEEHERVVLRRLSVFAGGFTTSAACTVCGAGPDHPDVLDAIESLVRKSMVQFDRDRSRYRLLETVRMYALERLADAGEQLDIRCAHAEWMASIVDHPLEDWYGAQGIAFAKAALREFDNWREAVMFAIETGDGALAPRYCRHLLAGDEPETARWAEALLAATNETVRGRQWMHWVAATGFASMLQSDACESHTDAFDALATSEAERSWSAVFRSVLAEARDGGGPAVLRRALVTPGLEATQRAFYLILLAFHENLPPNQDPELAATAVTEAVRLDHYATPIAYVTLAMASMGLDSDRALNALAVAEQLAADHPSVFVRTSVAGWGSLTLVGLPPEAAARHLLFQADQMQDHWTNAHLGLLATCSTVLRSTHPSAATRIAAFLLAQPGTEITLRRLWPDVNLDTFPPSSDDFDTVMFLTREALSALVNAEE